MWNLLGLLPLGVGVLLNLNADQVFHQLPTTVKPFARSSTLVTQGVYQFSRNLMYLGFALILLGIAILLRSLVPYLGRCRVCTADRPGIYSGGREDVGGAVWRAI